MDANALIAEAGALVGVPALALNEDGLCRLAIDDDLHVDIEHDAAAGRLHVYSSLGPLPPGRREALYEALLAGNLFGTETAGGALALDLTEREIILSRAFSPQDLEPHGLVAAIEDHVAAVELWRERLSGLAGDEAARDRSREDHVHELPGREGSLRA